MSKIYTITSEKGGVGKSFVAKLLLDRTLNQKSSGNIPLESNPVDLKIDLNIDLKIELKSTKADINNLDFKPE